MASVLIPVEKQQFLVLASETNKTRISTEFTQAQSWPFKVLEPSYKIIDYEREVTLKSIKKSLLRIHKIYQDIPIKNELEYAFKRKDKRPFYELLNSIQKRRIGIVSNVSVGDRVVSNLKESFSNL